MEAAVNPNELGYPTERGEPPSGVVQFDGFELRLETGELRRNGMRVRLQTKPFQLLNALIERPGRVVTREDLRTRLWPSDTFVDFESGLNTAANRLRIALGDSAENPRYIETLSRIGYRFIAPVRRVCPDRVVELRKTEIPAPSAEDATAAEPASSITDVAPAEPAVAPPAHDKRRWTRPAIIGVAALVLLGAGLWAGRFSIPHDNESFRQISFRRGLVFNARFTPSGEVVYSACWGADSPRVYLTDTLSPESRDLGFGDARLAAIGPSTELAIFQQQKSGTPWLFGRVPLHGGAPRAVSKAVVAADFSPVTGELVVVVKDDSGTSVEMPPGHPIFHTAGWVDVVRVAPDGVSVALLEHELAVDDAGGVVYIDRNRQARKLTGGWASILGLAWPPSGKEIWFSAARTGSDLGAWGVSLDGRLRPVSMHSGSFVLFDVARDGRALVSRFSRRLNMITGDARSHSSEEASWFDWTRAVAISADGGRLLFDETGAGGGDKQAVYLRHAADNTVERVGDGHALDLSPDGKRALTQARDVRSQLTLISWPDDHKTISSPGLDYQSARFIPGREAILVQANASSKPVGLYVQDLATGALRQLKGNEGLRWPMPSPDGGRAAAIAGYSHLVIIDLNSGAREDLNLPRSGVLVRWASNDKLVLMEPGRLPIPLWTYDLRTHKSAPLFDVTVPDPSARGSIAELVISADLRKFAYSYRQSGSELMIVSGWK